MTCYKDTRMIDTPITTAIVTGGRRFADRTRIYEDLVALLPYGLTRLAHGGNGIHRPRPWTTSADSLAQDAGEQLRNEGTLKDVDAFEVDCAVDGRWPAAGCRRNTRMIETVHVLGQTIGLAYPDPESRGTWHCVKEMLKRNISVILWAPGIDLSTISAAVRGVPALIAETKSVSGDMGHTLLVPHSLGDAQQRLQSIADIMSGWAVPAKQQQDVFGWVTPPEPRRRCVPRSTSGPR